jgi:voltage-dependent calcium channel T type alpha-1G
MINLEYKKTAKSVSIQKYRFFERHADYSLYLFSKENCFRKLCSCITLNKWFETVILIFVGLNCLTLAMERPSIPGSSIVSINIF